MASLTNATIYYESGQTQYGFLELSDSGDHKTFTLSTKPWSKAPGYEPVIAPYGLLTGGAVTPEASGTANQVDVAALTAMMPAATGANATTGVLSVGATADVAITRGASSNTHNITSITVTSAGVVAAVAGTPSTAFSETRGVAGGPPLIPVGSIEIAQVRTTSVSAIAVTASEIFQVYGDSLEASDSPVRVTESALEGKIVFASALPLIHTGGLPRKVYARVAVPIFAELGLARDFVPAERSSSVGTEQYYQATEGTESVSLAAASFTVGLNDGLTDAIMGKEGANVIIKYSPDKNKLPYSLTQGTLRLKTTNAYGKSPSAAVTIAASAPTVRFAS